MKEDMTTSAKDILKHVAPHGKSFHLAKSSDIRSAAVCGFKFKLPRIIGATLGGDERHSIKGKCKVVFINNRAISNKVYKLHQ